MELAPPRIRKLRGYAIDPSLSTAYSPCRPTNWSIYEVDWEKLDAETKFHTHRIPPANTGDHRLRSSHRRVLRAGELR